MIKEWEPGEKVIVVNQVMRERYANGSILHDRYVRSYACPLDDATIERLAKVAHESYWLPYQMGNKPVWDAEENTTEPEGDDWRRTVRAVLAALVGDDQ